MKKTILSLFTLLAVSISVNAQNVTIPDANFKACLVGNTLINTNNDSEIQVSEASAFTGTLNCNNQGISDMTGIETFTALQYLWCHANQLTSIDISNNSALMGLFCFSNQLTSLDLSNNFALTNLNCDGNLLTNLDLSNNTALEAFGCTGNQLTSLDLSNNTALVAFRCSVNQLTSLDLSNNTALTSLDCTENQLTSLNLSNNIVLEELYCSVNSIVSLDLSQLLSLQYLYCDNNNLSFLNIANGANGNVSELIASENPNLTCVQVDDAAWSTINWTSSAGDFNFDAGASFSENCCNVDVNTTVNANVISAENTTADSYQWVDCNNANTPITGETNATITPTVNGSYAVMITEGSCTETSSCTTISSVGINELTVDNIQLYPNPASASITIETDAIIENVKIFSMLGNLLINTNENNITVTELSPGVYFALVKTDAGSKQIKFIKK